MKIAYLLNTYPSTTQTFIRREIQALEAHGVAITRYAIRRWSEQLISEEDRIEASKTRYILSGRTPQLFGVFFLEVISNPVGMGRAFATLFRLVRNAGGGFVRHAAYMLEAATVKRWAAQDGIALVHTHFSTNAAAVALLSSRLGGPRYSFTAHGQDEFDDSRASLAEKVEGAQFIVAISSYCRVQVARLAGMSAWKKTKIVRCGLDFSEFDGKEAVYDGNFTFVCVGRLCVQKAQTLIVEAVSIVRRTHPEVRVMLIGDGETRADVEAAIAHFDVAGNIEILGWQSNADVRQALVAARALLLPSFSEGLPIVLMEAQALERPVITTYIGGIPELVDQECGWVIPAGSIEHIAGAMIAALETSSEQLTRMGAAGRKRVTAAHDISRNTEVLRDLFVTFGRPDRDPQSRAPAC